MLIKIECKLDNTLILPINYQYMVQGAIYRLLSYDKKYGRKLHDEGVLYNNREYRLFTFGRLHGDLKIIEKNVEFRNSISLEVRSVDREIISILSNNIERFGFLLGEKRLEPYRLYVEEPFFEGEILQIKMDSPITVYRTDKNKKTIYYSPWEEEFYQRVKDNLARKYQAFLGKRIPTDEMDIILKPLHITNRDKVVTRYKGNYINGWKGIYSLEGKNEVLRFLYNTGLGSKNAQGFGMFQILTKE